MIFHREEPDEHYRALRMVSADGKWVLGLAVYASGTRVRMGRPGRPPTVLDFCMGIDPGLYGGIFDAVVRRLEPLAEDRTAAEIDAVFPWAGTRPDLAVHLEALLFPSISHEAAEVART